MSSALFFPQFLGVLQTAPDTSSPTATPAPQIRDIAPPVDVFPYPPWMVATAIAVAVILLGLIIWFIVSWIRHRSGPPPLSATTIALLELEKLRAKTGEIEPYGFSVAVSDVLRTFISNAKFRLPATRLTSPEFLAAISGSQLFSEDDRSLLGHFLEKCDMIKFARMQATSADNSELVESALAFVQGGRA
ncbi:MAG: DUF4381 family protein [Chthoniobacter sp.]|nr:DUF4381 family protein [Chthoniobacter sp.]